MEKLCASKTFFEMAGGGMHTLVLPPGSAPGHSYRNHQKILAYFSHLAPLVFFLFYLKAESKGRGVGHGTRIIGSFNGG